MFNIIVTSVLAILFSIVLVLRHLVSMEKDSGEPPIKNIMGNSVSGDS